MGKGKSLLRNFSYSLSSNLIYFFVTAIVILIIPKLIGVDEYGYFQLYIFYIAYVGILHLGWNDGVYLRYGGYEYSKLNFALFRSQFYTLFLFQVVLAILIIILSYTFTSESERSFILISTSIGLVLINVRYFLIYTLQATNRIREFARITILDRSLYALFLLIYTMLGGRDFRIMILADLSGKFVSLIYATQICKEFTSLKFKNVSLNAGETFKNISSGIKLMFANLSSILIIGILRFGIERKWDIGTFGKISLTLSISNFLMIFVNSLGIVFYPLLRRTDSKSLTKIYSVIRTLLLSGLLGILLFYYPAKHLLISWLPNYELSFKYMSILFPMVVFEGKVALLVNTYMKTLRMERIMLIVNSISLLISVSLAIICIIILENLDLTVFSILIALAARSFISEIILCKRLNIRVYENILSELILTSVFIILFWMIDSWFGFLIYAIVYLVYLIRYRKQIKKSFIVSKSYIHM